MSAKVISCACPICAKVFMARNDQVRNAAQAGRDGPCCSHACERERRYSESRDRKWKAEQEKIVNGFYDTK
jgi:hypothetical protein